MRKTVWEKRGVVEQNQNQDSNEVQPKHIDALNSYDRDKKELFDYMSEIATNGFEEFDEGMSAAYMHNTARSFAKAVTALREELVDIEDPEQILRQLWVADDNERVEFYRSLTQDETFQFVAEDEMDDIVQEIYAESDSYAELEEQIMKNYKEYLRTDTNNLLGRLQRIYGVEDESESDIDLYEQGPEVLELVKKLESIAFQASDGFKESYEDGISLSKKVTDLNGEFETEFLLYAERAHIVNDTGIIETTTEYNVGSHIKYFYHGIESLPSYVRDSLCDIAQDEISEFSLEDILDENNLFILLFTYSVTANDEGMLFPYCELELKWEDIDLPIADVGGFSPESIPLEEKTKPTEDEQKLFSTIFTEEEISDINASTEENTVIYAEDDLIEAFRRNISSIKFATSQQHIAMAGNLADEFMQKEDH
jgi:hypothetical protein